MAEKIQLVPGNVVYPALSFLADEMRLDDYKERIAKYGERARKTLDIFRFGNGVLIGSNPFANVELASADIALPSQLEHAVRLAPDFFRGTFEDVGLVLRTNGDSYTNNDYVAKNLFQQVRKKTGESPTPECPARISLKGLKLRENDKSAYGLVFRLGDETEVDFVSEFANLNGRKRFLRTDEKGVPLFDVDGKRILYTRQEGLSVLCLDGLLSLGSDDGNLASSNDDGRVVLIK